MVYSYHYPRRYERRQPEQEQEFFEEGEDGAQVIPVNVFETPDEYMIVAPVPGIEADNLDIMVHGNMVTIRAGLRGEGQERREYLRREWRYGNYFRRVQLPMEVDAQQANASLGNGVLTLALPKIPSARPHRIKLNATGPAEGKQDGHSGHIAGGPSPKES